MTTALKLEWDAVVLYCAKRGTVDALPRGLTSAVLCEIDSNTMAFREDVARTIKVLALERTM